MCDFVSWIEYEGKNYFTTSLDLETKEAKKLIREGSGPDISGHGFIRALRPELNGRGIDRECTDFSMPDNFPTEVVEQIKRGNMRYGKPNQPEQLLTQKALKKIKADAAQKKADAAWQKDKAAQKKADAAWQKENAVWQKAYAAWQKADAAWQKEKADAEIIWKLFDDPKNRQPAWR